MAEMVKIYLNDTETEYDIPSGCSLLEIAQIVGVDCDPLAAYVNNRLRELTHRVYTNVTIRYVDITSFAGIRVYQRTMWLVLQRAIETLYPSRRLYIRHSMGVNGFYCEVEGKDNFLCDEIDDIRAAMRDIVDRNMPITRQKIRTKDVRELYAERGYIDKIQLLDTRPRLFSELYRLDDTIGYFYGSLAPSTRYVQIFEVQSYYRGFYLSLPQRDNPLHVSVSPHQQKMFNIFKEYQHWVDIMGVPTVGALNAQVLAGDGSELIKVGEALHEKKIIALAEMISIVHERHNTRIALLSGPSSSGKTSTAKRLGIQLRVMGFSPVLISLDDYFVDRDKTPLDENGEYDYEALEAIDIELFNSNLKRLLDGESVDIPRYDFISGERRSHDKPLKLADNSIIIIEGIHGLNPKLTPSLPADSLFRIYVSCFTTVAMDNTSRIATSDNRLLRRLTRDFRTRGNDGLSTLARWASVRRGEERHIFPYQENADVMFNSSLFYEISVLRRYVEPILHDVPNTSVEYDDARRLLKFLDNFIPIDPSEIPPTSLLREFIGGSSFKY